MNPTRSLTDSQSPGDEGYADEEGHEPSSKAFNEMTEIPGLISKEEAWDFDVSRLLDSPTTIPTRREGQRDGSNFKDYDEKKSLFVLCVMGSISCQLQFLCANLPKLLQISPNLQTLILTRDPPTALSAFEYTPLSFPIVEAQGNPPNHFLKLGLLSPLGGGRQPLDAIVLLDPSGKRRLVLPWGWDAGRHIADFFTGNLVQARYATVLEDSIKALENEKIRKKKDFYDIARSFF